jgi:hypothetical protein
MAYSIMHTGYGVFGELSNAMEAKEAPATR